MKVKIGPYRSRWTSQAHYDYMNKKYDYIWPEYEKAKGLVQPKAEPFKEILLRKLEDVLQWVYNHTVNLYLDNSKVNRKVKIHKYDTWSMDHTLAYIVHPMLIQLKETKHGAPNVDDEDVPEELRSTNAPPKENEWDTDDNWHLRWDWVMDEMIWAFEQKTIDWEDQYYGEWIEDATKPFGGYNSKNDFDGMKKHQERMSNGFRLFGKYYEGLWD